MYGWSLNVTTPPKSCTSKIAFFFLWNRRTPRFQMCFRIVWVLPIMPFLWKKQQESPFYGIWSYRFCPTMTPNWSRRRWIRGSTSGFRGRRPAVPNITEFPKAYVIVCNYIGVAILRSWKSIPNLLKHWICRSAKSGLCQSGVSFSMKHVTKRNKHNPVSSGQAASPKQKSCCDAVFRLWCVQNEIYQNVSLRFQYKCDD